MEENVIKFNANVKALEKSVVATNHAMSELGWLVKDLQKSFSAGFGGGISGELAGIHAGVLRVADAIENSGLPMWAQWTEFGIGSVSGILSSMGVLWDGNTFNKVKESIDKVVENFKNMGSSILDGTKNWLQEGVLPKFQEFSGFITQKMIPAIKNVGTSVADLAKGFVTGAANTIADTAAKIANTAAQTANTVATWAQVAATTAWNAICTAATAVTTALNVPQIPYLAQGAVLPANKPFLAVVGDQKHGTNVEAPLETIQQALANVLASQGPGDIRKKNKEQFCALRNKAENCSFCCKGARLQIGNSK